MPHNRSAMMVAALVLLPAALAGCVCAGQPDTQSTTAPTAQPTPARVRAAATVAADATTQPPIAATTQPQSAATAAAAAANAAVVGSDGDKTGTRLVLNSLARGSGDTLTLRFTVNNNSDASLNMTAPFHGRGCGARGH